MNHFNTLKNIILSSYQLIIIIIIISPMFATAAETKSSKAAYPMDGLSNSFLPVGHHRSALPDDPFVTGYSNWPNGITVSPQSFLGGVYDGADGIWLIPNKADSIVKIDRKTGRMTSSKQWPSGVAVGTTTSFSGAAFDGKTLWLVPVHDGTYAPKLVSLDTTTGATNDLSSKWPTLIVTRSFYSAAYDGNGYVWFFPSRAEGVAKLDVKTNVMTAYLVWPTALLLYITADDKTSGGVYDGTYWWLVPRSFSKIVRVSSTGAMTAYDLPNGFSTSDAQFRCRGGTFDGTYVWMIPFGGNGFIKLNPTSGVSTLVLYDSALATGVYDGKQIWCPPYYTPASGGAAVGVRMETSGAFRTQNMVYSATTGDKFEGSVFDGTSVWFVPATGSAVARLDGRPVTSGDGMSQGVRVDTPSANPFTLHNMSMQLSTVEFWDEATIGHSMVDSAVRGAVFDGTSFFFVPHMSRSIIQMNANSHAAHGDFTFPDALTFSSTNLASFVGGVFDGRSVFLIPASARAIVEIAVVDRTMKLHNSWPTGYPTPNSFSCAAAVNGKIYLIPKTADKLIELDPTTSTMTEIDIGIGVSDEFTAVAFDGTRLWLAPGPFPRITLYNTVTGHHNTVDLNTLTGLTLGSSAGAGGNVVGYCSAVYVHTTHEVWLIPEDASHIVRASTIDWSVKLVPWPDGYTHTAKDFGGAVFDGVRLWLVPRKLDRFFAVRVADMKWSEPWGQSGGKSLKGGSTATFVGGAFDGTNVWMVPEIGKKLIRIGPKAVISKTAEATGTPTISPEPTKTLSETYSATPSPSATTTRTLSSSKSMDTPTETSTVSNSKKTQTVQSTISKELTETIAHFTPTDELTLTKHVPPLERTKTPVPNVGPVKRTSTKTSDVFGTRPPPPRARTATPRLCPLDCGPHGDCGFGDGAPSCICHSNDTHGYWSGSKCDVCISTDFLLSSGCTQCVPNRYGRTCSVECRDESTCHGRGACTVTLSFESVTVVGCNCTEGSFFDPATNCLNCLSGYIPTTTTSSSSTPITTCTKATCFIDIQITAAKISNTRQYLEATFSGADAARVISQHQAPSTTASSWCGALFDSKHIAFFGQGYQCSASASTENNVVIVRVLFGIEAVMDKLQNQNLFINPSLTLQNSSTASTCSLSNPISSATVSAPALTLAEITPIARLNIPSVVSDCEQTFWVDASASTLPSQGTPVVSFDAVSMAGTTTSLTSLKTVLNAKSQLMLFQIDSSLLPTADGSRVNITVTISTTSGGVVVSSSASAVVQRTSNSDAPLLQSVDGVTTYRIQKGASLQLAVDVRTRSSCGSASPASSGSSDGYAIEWVSYSDTGVAVVLTAGSTFIQKGRFLQLHRNFFEKSAGKSSMIVAMRAMAHNVVLSQLNFTIDIVESANVVAALTVNNVKQLESSQTQYTFVHDQTKKLTFSGACSSNTKSSLTLFWSWSLCEANSTTGSKGCILNGTSIHGAAVLELDVPSMLQTSPATRDNFALTTSLTCISTDLNINATKTAIAQLYLSSTTSTNSLLLARSNISIEGPTMHSSSQKLVIRGTSTAGDDALSWSWSCHARDVSGALHNLDLSSLSISPTGSSSNNIVIFSTALLPLVTYTFEATVKATQGGSGSIKLFHTVETFPAPSGGSLSVDIDDDNAEVRLRGEGWLGSDLQYQFIVVSEEGEVIPLSSASSRSALVPTLLPMYEDFGESINVFMVDVIDSAGTVTTTSEATFILNSTTRGESETADGNSLNFTASQPDTIADMLITMLRTESCPENMTLAAELVSLLTLPTSSEQRLQAKVLLLLGDCAARLKSPTSVAQKLIDSLRTSTRTVENKPRQMDREDAGEVLAAVANMVKNPPPMPRLNRRQGSSSSLDLERAVSYAKDLVDVAILDVSESMLRGMVEGEYQQVVTPGMRVNVAQQGSGGGEPKDAVAVRPPNGFLRRAVVTTVQWIGSMPLPPGLVDAALDQNRTSDVVSVVMKDGLSGERMERFNSNQPVEITIPLKGNRTQNTACTFYNFTSAQFETRGCRVESINVVINVVALTVTCVCDHLTDFAVYDDPAQYVPTANKIDWGNFSDLKAGAASLIGIVAVIFLVLFIASYTWHARQVYTRKRADKKRKEVFL
eukprot:PhM_4_TR1257/c0_g1_i2/m.81182